MASDTLFNLEGEDEESAESRFKRYFPHATRLICFTAHQQFELLYRAYWLCVNSNRNKEIKISQRIPDTVIVSRRADGVCCHPIFINHKTFKLQRAKLQDPEFILRLMVRNCMLSASQENRYHYERHPSYCEEFRAGDLLKLVVPHELRPGMDGLTPQFHKADEFEADEGCFTWVIDRQHPNGYPQLTVNNSIDSLFNFEI